MSVSKKEKRWPLLEELENKHPTAYFFGDLLINIIIILILVVGVRKFLISPFQVYGPSMCDSLNYIHEECQDGFGEYLIVNKALYRMESPERGDIIVFRPPHNEDEYYIKRIIGLPGETIKLQNGKVYIVDKEHPRGVELKEDYLNKANKSRTMPVPSQVVTSYEVPVNYYFVLGDNRLQSTDSRACFKGAGERDCRDSINHYLPLERIEGKASVVLWPFNKVRLLENPAYNG